MAGAVETDFDILIIGAGLVGASIAAALGRREAGAGLRLAVVEAGGEPAHFSGTEFDPRVVALTNASQRYLSGFGAWDSIAAARLCPYTDMHVWDAEGTGSIHFDCREVGQPGLGHIVENSVALSAVRECLSRCGNVQLRSPFRVTGLNRESGRVTVALDRGPALSASLLIAADGANSRVRQLGHFRTREWDYGQSAIITTVRTEEPHRYTAWQRFLSSGPLAFLPLRTEGGDCHFCSIVWSTENEYAAALMELDEAEFCCQLTTAFENRLGAVTATAERFCIPLRQRHAVEYIQPGVALVGDAAHTIHPLAGQGVNLGFLDARVLTEEIGRALDRGIPLSDFSILRRYQRRRMGGNLGMMGVMEAFKRLFGAKDLSVRWARNAGMRQLDNLPALKNAVVRRAMGM